MCGNLYTVFLYRTHPRHSITFGLQYKAETGTICVFLFLFVMAMVILLLLIVHVIGTIASVRALRIVALESHSSRVVSSALAPYLRATGCPKSHVRFPAAQKPEGGVKERFLPQVWTSTTQLRRD